jgi:hypothetical protein
MRIFVILMLMPFLLKSQALVTVSDLEMSFSLEAKASKDLLSKKGLKFSAAFKDPLQSDRDVMMYDKGEAAKDYSSIKQTTYNGAICSVEYSSYLKSEHDSLLKQALSMGYLRKNNSTQSYEKGKFLLSSSSFPDFNGQELYSTTVSDQTILNKIGW